MGWGTFEQQLPLSQSFLRLGPEGSPESGALGVKHSLRTFFLALLWQIIIPSVTPLYIDEGMYIVVAIILL